jgi:hypothetical protein
MCRSISCFYFLLTPNPSLESEEDLSRSLNIRYLCIVLLFLKIHITKTNPVRHPSLKREGDDIRSLILMI